MVLFKCKMCGGTIEFEPGSTIGVCDSCGTKQTLPRLDSDKKANMYDRANHFRRNNDYDKAMAIYEQILLEDNTYAECYWSILLCRYGIEYVEDPTTNKRIPTINRAQFASIFDDEDYKSAMQYADVGQRDIYETEARTISEIQKGILEISSREDPFDCFISFKETDANGRRTRDAVLAQELYNELTREGFNVFFAPVTLEDKLGTAYEPYIFAALNSAKVMVVLGTKSENFNAVWVKNEWSRYLALIRSGAKKTLIPAYRDMDPYDLPEEFSHLMAQDMSKLGFMQDLIRGIKKIIGTGELKRGTKEVGSSTVTDGNTAPLLKRAFIFLDDGNWSDADAYCEKVLDIDPENAEAYVGKLMAELNVPRQDELCNYPISFDNNTSYKKAVRYADEKLANELQGYINEINTRNENERLKAEYQEAKALMEAAADETKYQEAAERFSAISGYCDAEKLVAECREKAETAHNESIYQSAFHEESTECSYIEGKAVCLEKAISIYEQIPEYKDSKDKISKLRADLSELNENIARKKRKKKRIAIVTISAITLISLFLVAFFNVIMPAVKYSSAQKCVEDKNYTDALAKYEQLGDYKDSSEKAISTRYLLACYQLENKDYENAYNNFGIIKDYEDSKIKQQESGYEYAKELMAKQDFGAAEKVLQAIDKYESSKDFKNQCSLLKTQCYLELAEKCYADSEYRDAVYWYEKVLSTDRNEDMYTASCYQSGLQLIKSGDFALAITYLNKAGDKADAQEQIKVAKYGYVMKNKNRYDTMTCSYLKSLVECDYKDSAEVYNDLYGWKVTVIAINSDPDDTSTNKTSISKYDPVYFHFKLTGGEPGAGLCVKETDIIPSGESHSGKMDWEMHDGDTVWWGWENGIYTNPAYGVGGKMTMRFYDDSGNLIGEGSVNITS